MKKSEELVVELGGNMGTSDHIDPMGVEEYICKSEVEIVYF